MRLVTWNVRYFGHGLKGLASTAASMKGIARALMTLDPVPEVVALQEVETRSLRSGLVHRRADATETQLDAFMGVLHTTASEAGRSMPWRALYFPAHAYRLGSLTLYTTGLAVLVDPQRLRVISDNMPSPRHITHVVNEQLRGVKQTRIAAHLELEDLRNRRFHLFNTHLSLPTAWAREFWAQPGKMGFGVNQVHEARALSDFANATAGSAPSLLLGDFNAAPHTPVYDELTRARGWVGAQERVGQLSEPFPTAGFLHLRMHLDHVFGAGGVEFVDMKDTHRFGDPLGPFAGLSDHVPLLSTFELP